MTIRKYVHTSDGHNRINLMKPIRGSGNRSIIELFIIYMDCDEQKKNTPSAHPKYQ